MQSLLLKQSVSYQYRNRLELNMHTDFIYDYYKTFGSMPVQNFEDPIQTLKDAYNMPPEKAIEFFKSKGYKISWSWQDVEAAVHLQAFTVAKVMSADMLQFFKDELDKALEGGQTFEDFKKNITVRLAEAGWTGKKEVIDPKTGAKSMVEFTPSRLKTIYETNMQSSLMQGRYDGMKAAVDSHPYGIYSNGDPKADICIELDGQVVRLDDPGLRIPPFHYRCKTRISPMSERNVIREGLTVRHAESLYEKGGGVQSGFNAPPDKTYTPSTSKYDPAIGAALKSALKGKK